MELEPHRAPLVTLAYRITGDHAEAEDVVQEAFLRAMTRRPDASRPLRPWLRTVVANLSRDVLRRRRRRPYVGPWMPTPVQLPSRSPDPEQLMGEAQAVSWAVLVASERLTPQQRTVMVLREVAELTAPEVAAMLDTTPAAVRAAHTRARRVLAGVSPEPEQAVDWMPQRLGQLMAALATGDLPTVRAVFAPDAVARNDGGGEVAAATRVVYGADRVARLLLGLARKNAGALPELTWLNDRPGLLLHVDPAPAGKAPLTALLLILAPDGRIAEVNLVSAPRKLQAVGRGLAPAQRV